MATTTFQINSNPTNGSLSSFNATTGAVLYTPNIGYAGLDSFTYDILCDGIVVDTATANIDVLCIPVNGGTILSNDSATIGIDETFIVAGITGLPPFTYTHSVVNGILVSGQGNNTFVVTPTGHPMVVTTVISNCSGNSTVGATKTLAVKVGCTPIVNVKFNCFVPANITGTLQGINEPNRVVFWNNSSIQFTADVGLHNYSFVVTDTTGQTHTVVLKNIMC